MRTTTLTSFAATTTLVLAFAAPVLSVESAEARPKPRVSKKFEANKTFGLGVMLGSTTGLNGKLYLSDNTALDFGIGAYDDDFRGAYNDDGLQIHGDFLWHPVVLASPDAFELPLHIGLGFRYLDHDDDFFDDNRVDDHEHLGLRAPIGLSLDFNRVPIDIFFELALVVDIATFDNGDDFDDFERHRRSEVDGSVGLRYYF